MAVIVDVANVVGARPDGWWRDRAGAATRLAASVAALAAPGSSGAGDGSAAAAPGSLAPGSLAPGSLAPGSAAPGSAAPADAAPAAYVLVLEGQARSASIPPAPGVSVVRAPGSGDDAIASLAGPGDVVVTADRELRRRVEAAGAVAEGPGWLLRQLVLLR